jgi:glucose/arabinose dehydrogenase
MRPLYPLGVSVILLLAGSASARPLLRPAPELTVPAGWVAERYASGLTRPTALAFGSDGRLYVAQEPGQILVVGVGSTRPRVVARGFSEILGLAWKGRQLFVSSKGRLYRLNLAGKALTGRRALLTKLPNGRHQQDNVVVGRDGRLYVGNGSTCDACVEKSRLSATILSVRPDGRDLRVFATGLRNPYGLAIQPRTGRLYATVNGRDDLGNSEPAEMLVRVEQGRDFGWPECWPNFAEKRLTGSCSGVTPPVAYLEPRSGAGSLAFSRDGRSAYVALWGQYFGPHGRTLVRVDLAPEGSATGQRVFARGFGHPLAVLVTQSGAILVSDWERGRIYRIRPR